LSEAEQRSARRKKWKAFRRRLFPRGIRFTRQGKLYTVVTLGVGLAAVNTGNNLLFLVLGLMLGLIVVSGILSEISLRGVEIRRGVPRHAEVDVVFPVELSVTNKKRFASSFGVELRDEIDDVLFKRRCFFLRVSPGETRSIAYRCELHKRGIATFQGTIVSTRFPFGLFEKTRFVPLEDHTIALPKQLRINLPEPASLAGEGGKSLMVKGLGQEFRELREMVPGDDPRLVDWRSTARLGQMMVRQNDVDASGFVELVLDPSAAKSGHESPDDEVERNISVAASMVKGLVSRDVVVRLVTSPPAVLVASSSNDVITLLEHLALLDPTLAASSPPPLGHALSSVLIGPRADTTGAAERFRVAPLRGFRRAG
jgi:uncharacterized protein (DUF58 family)